jgi:hypothetical protein
MWKDRSEYRRYQVRDLAERRYKDNNKMDLKEKEYEVVDWINLALVSDQWRALVNTATNIRVPYKEENVTTDRMTTDLSRKALFYEVSSLIITHDITGLTNIKVVF